MFISSVYYDKSTTSFLYCLPYGQRYAASAIDA